MIFKFIPIELIKALFLLVLGITANILAGTTLAKIRNKENYEKFIKGLEKGVSVIIVTIIISLAASIDNTIVINDTPIVEYLIQAIKIAYIYYLGQSAVKVVQMINFKTEEGIEIYEKVEEE